MWNNLGNNLRNNLDNTFWGQHELYWIAYYDFCNLIGVSYNKSNRIILDKWLNIGKSTGWWIPFENVCFCFERHNILKTDNNGKLHCVNGPAMAFKDGYSLYYWHGEQIPNNVIDDNINNIEIQIKTWQAFKNV